MKMHDGEFEIDESLVRVLLKQQCPQWASLPLQRLITSGTDHALFRLGNEYVVRLPRLEGANEKLNKEWEWIPRLSEFLKIPISKPVFKGTPAHSYPSLWYIARWNEGHVPQFEQENEYEFLAKDLALFINELHEVKLTNGPLSRRGVPLKKLDDETRNAILQLKDDIDTLSVATLWNQLSIIPYWKKDPVWIHGDLLPGNILVQNNRLSAVIDFSDVGMGDPACDFIIAWSLLNPRSRSIFKHHLKNVDEDTWQRGRGWALSIALIILPYYRDTNPTLAAVARQILKNINM